MFGCSPNPCVVTAKVNVVLFAHGVASITSTTLPFLVTQTVTTFVATVDLKSVNAQITASNFVATSQA